MPCLSVFLCHQVAHTKDSSPPLSGCMASSATYTRFLCVVKWHTPMTPLSLLIWLHGLQMQHTRFFLCHQVAHTKDSLSLSLSATYKVLHDT
jgi:hypothetical protein